MRLTLNRNDIDPKFKTETGAIKVPDSELSYQHLTPKAQAAVRIVGKGWLEIGGFIPPAPRWVKSV